MRARKRKIGIALEEGRAGGVYSYMCSVQLQLSVLIAGPTAGATVPTAGVIVVYVGVGVCVGVGYVD